MAGAALYPPANRTAQWFATQYPGATADAVDRLVLHTTEGSGWPTYQGGAIAPGWTAKPVETVGRWLLVFRQHFPAGMASRALRNLPGGVETNTARAAQVELIGTCVRGGPGLYWPEAPDELLEQLGEFVAWLHVEHGLALDAAPLWVPALPWGTDGQRMTFAQWSAFRGVCGHEHVPEQDHRDPGAFPVTSVLAHARAHLTPTPEAPMPPTPPPPTTRQIADALLDTPLPDGTLGSDGHPLTFRYAITRTYHRVDELHAKAFPPPTVKP